MSMQVLFQKRNVSISVVSTIHTWNRGLLYMYVDIALKILLLRHFSHPCLIRLSLEQEQKRKATPLPRSGSVYSFAGVGAKFYVIESDDNHAFLIDDNKGAVLVDELEGRRGGLGYQLNSGPHAKSRQSRPGGRWKAGTR